MTDQEEAVILFDMALTLAFRLEVYSDEAIKQLKERLNPKDLEPRQLNAMLDLIDAMRAS